MGDVIYREYEQKCYLCVGAEVHHALEAATENIQACETVYSIMELRLTGRYFFGRTYFGSQTGRLFSTSTASCLPQAIY